MIKKSSPSFLHSRKGAQLLEYVLLFLIIIAGVVVATPQVRNQVNARIKGYDDAQKDAIRENPIKSPTTSLLPACACDWEIGFCGGGDGGVTCAPNQKANLWKCDPVHCQPPQVQCIDSPGECCTTENGLCGVLANCQDGSRQIKYFCSTSTTVPTYTVCEPDVNCDFACRTNGVPSPIPSGFGYFGLCSGDNSSLLGNTEYSTVLPNGCTLNKKCEIECSYPFVNAQPHPVTGLTTTCECPDHSSVSGATCVCDSGYAYPLCQSAESTCPSGYMLAP